MKNAFDYVLFNNHACKYDAFKVNNESENMSETFALFICETSFI